MTEEETGWAFGAGRGRAVETQRRKLRVELESSGTTAKGQRMNREYEGCVKDSQELASD